MNNDEKKTETYKTGMVNRRKVLGDKQVDRALESSNEFNGAFQEFITRVTGCQLNRCKKPQLRA